MTETSISPRPGPGESCSIGWKRRSANASIRTTRWTPCVRCARKWGRLPSRMGIGKAHLRALRHHPVAHGGRPGLRVRVPRRGLAAGPPPPGRPCRWPIDSSWPSTPRSSPTVTANSTSPRNNRSGSGVRPKRWPGATWRRTRPTWPSCGPSSTASHRPPVSASVSTG